MSFGFDPEAPAGFQDADIEMRELEEAANEVGSMPSTYLDEKVGIVRDYYERIDTSPGCIRFTPGAIDNLYMVQKAAQAIVKEITTWTGMTP